jgi:hypothetical protein
LPSTRTETVTAAADETNTAARIAIEKMMRTRFRTNPPSARGPIGDERQVF